MNEFTQRYGNTIWSGLGIAAGLYVLGARGPTLIKYTVGAMAGAWIANMGKQTGVTKQPPLAKKSDEVAQKATG